MTKLVCPSHFSLILLIQKVLCFCQPLCAVCPLTPLFGYENRSIRSELKSALALLMLGILADDQDSAFSFNDFALVANRFY